MHATRHIEVDSTYVEVVYEHNVIYQSTFNTIKNLKTSPSEHQM